MLKSLSSGISSCKRKGKKMKPRKNCIVCEKKIYRSSRRGQLKTRRQNFTLTCSRKCAKIYIRIRKHVVEYYRRRIKRLERKIKELENEISKKN